MALHLSALTTTARGVTGYFSFFILTLVLGMGTDAVASDHLTNGYYAHIRDASRQP